jgi:DNA helicase HerA-like ATPase
VNEILLGKSVLQPADVYLHARYGNRHGMVAGATGTGKTVSLMVMAEGFSRLGVPVFRRRERRPGRPVAGVAVVTDKLPRLTNSG